jgi:hypothetical protein
MTRTRCRLAKRFAMLFKNERLCFGNYSQILSRYEDTVKRCFLARLPVQSSTLLRCAAFWGIMQIGQAASGTRWLVSTELVA